MSTTTVSKAIDIALQQALAAQGAGKVEQAYGLYLQAIQGNPGHPQANHNLGVLDMQAGRTAQALVRFQTALQNQPLEAQFWISYVKALMVAGQLDQARQSLVLGQGQGLAGAPVDALAAQLGVRRNVPAEQCNAAMSLVQGGYLAQAEALARGLVQQDANFPAAWLSLAAALRAQGRFEQAMEAVLKAQALAPQSLDVLCNLGVIHLDLRQFQQGAGYFEKVLSQAPHLAEVQYFLGNAYASLGRFADADAAYAKAIELNPQLLEARFNLANVQKEAGRLDQAIITLQQLVSMVPSHAEAHYLLGVLMQATGAWDAASRSYHTAIAQRPEMAEAHNNLAVLLQREGKLEEAASAARQAVSLAPDEPNFLNVLSGILSIQGNSEEAGMLSNRALEAALLNIVKLAPDNPGGYANLGVYYTRNGRLDEGIQAYERSIALQPDTAHANDSLMFARAYDGRQSPAFYLDQARQWEQRVIPQAARDAARNKRFQRSARQGRPLQVGYVSGDFKTHAVASFVEALFANHDKSRVVLTAYSSAADEDRVSDRIKAHCAHWERIAGVDDKLIVEQMNARGIDVLIDLSGYTGLNRLQAFAYRAAPVQAHYLGYFASTGLTEMDYWIADEVIVPPSMDDQFSEKVWRLPRPYCAYQGRDDAPAIQHGSAGPLRLASFNGISKITDVTLALWAQILRALPEASLLLKHTAFAEPQNRKRVEAVLAQHGIAPERVEFKGNIQDWSEHMDLYNSVDIALDPIGAHAGVTTTCDALWMGVPVVTKAGDRMAQRQGASILTALGRPEWIASSNEDYVQKVLQLANDPQLRQSIRATQRDSMRASALCDARGMAAALEDAYEAMFDLWATRNQA